MKISELIKQLQILIESIDFQIFIEQQDYYMFSQMQHGYSAGMKKAYEEILGFINENQ